MIKVHILNATVINPFPFVIYYRTCTWISCVCSAVTKLQTRAAQLRLTFVNVILKLTASVQIHGCIERKKYLWNIFISHDGWVVTHRGYKNGKLTSDSCCRWLHLLSQIAGTPSRLAEVAIVWLFPLLSSFFAFHALPSFSPPFLRHRYLAVLLVHPPLSSPPPPLVLGSPTVVMRCFIICISRLLIEREFRLSPGSSVRELPWETWQA